MVKLIHLLGYLLLNYFFWDEFMGPVTSALEIPHDKRKSVVRNISMDMNGHPRPNTSGWVRP